MSDDLAGYRVLDFTIWRPGPYATQLLAERGADIVKVEPPGGDPMRTYPALFERLNRRKQSIEVDLKTDDGRGRALELAADADVVIESFRPGVVARLGVDYDAIKAVRADVVYCSLSGMGQTGPLRDVAGHDLNYLAWAGALAPDGGAPRWPAIPVADLAGGMAAAFRICSALVHRRDTGAGAYLDVAMADVVATWTGDVRAGAHGGAPGYGIFATADDAHITVAIVSEDHFWRGLCDVLGLDVVRDLDFAARLTRLDELQTAIADRIARRERDALLGDLLANGVPAAPVLDRDGMLALDHFAEREVFGPRR